MIIATRLEEAIDLKNQCFKYRNFEGWAYWWETVEFLESLLQLYTKE